jgi:membrane-bound lytic murein transglycosylase D
MRRAWLVVVLFALAACSSRSVESSDPVPAEPSDEVAYASANPEPGADSVASQLKPAAAGTSVSLNPEVEAEVVEMFGAREVEELKAETPTWDIPITINDAVERWLKYFQTDGRQNFAIWLARSGRYEPMMRAVFRDAGLPEDLVYLSMIESGFSPRAYSRARAVGLWQFISSTGRLYDLQISYWVDERRDPILATKAAAAHLKDLHDEFGSWYLAAAAYNGGAGRVRRGIRRTGSDDFWTLSQRRYLRRETRNYVPKLIAAALIAKQPENHSFFDIEQATPLAYEYVQVPEATSLNVIADAAGVSVSELTALNPQILRGVTPPGQRYSLRVPPGAGHRFALNYANVPASNRVTWVQHVVRRGDTLSEIAQAYGVSISAIQAANKNVRARRLRIGQRLIIPRAGKLPRYASTPTTVRRATPRKVDPQRPEGPFITYRVQRGDSLWLIAKRYDVSARDLMRWNGLTNSRIYPGDEVRVYVRTSP